MKFYPNIKIEIVNTHEDVELGVRPKKHQKKQYSSSSRPTKLFTSYHKTKSSSGYNLYNKTNYKQDCTVRGSYRTTKDLHIKNFEYIQKEGKGLNGQEPELYGSDNKEEYKNKMVDKNWRYILSPGTNQINLDVFTKRFVEKLENETGYKLTWVAANHYDTDNYHTHLLINGIDKNGREVNFLPREKVKYLFRIYAQDICTEMIGSKTKNQLETEFIKMIKKNYYTKLDKKIETMIDSQNELNKDFLQTNKGDLLNQRIQHLMILKLCEYDKKKQKFIFKNNWTEELKLLGKYNTYADGFKYASCSPNEYYIHDLNKDGKIEGKLLHKYIRQKDSNNFALVIQRNDGRVGYVPLDFYPKNCFNGDIIKIEKGNTKTFINNYTRKTK